MDVLKTNDAIVTSTSQEQITLPKEALDILKVSEGDRITIIYENDYIVITNPTIYAFRKLRQSMEGEFEKAGINSDEDILEICLQIRKEIEGF
ncbi:MAG: AbrB/MazE/SpoVT family DNA-binding domain-containing protein [Deltaproteobacteria bacterium]|jgi:bifunctional DNA-binding transcriptional regulator/antitoxin component of YhaV-PrlF toxin-antitoxin module|nr:AbrB/MazE/SpoVT family DNA-binding domain-containing protein [Deltaproteobacteria bacterium]